MNATLLPELAQTQADLLPVGTRVFVTRLRLRPLFWWLAAGLAILAPFMLILTAAQSSGRGALAAFTIVTLGSLCAVSTVVWMVDRRKYVDAVARGTWLLGVVVFPTGDVVIRDRRFLELREHHVEKHSLIDVAVDDAASAASCFRRRRTLRIKYTDTSGAASVLRFSADRFVDDARIIMAAIMELQRK